jgi:hypothetical protein
MGQRAYREKYTNSLVRDYMHNKNNTLQDQYFFSGKPKDVKFIFDLDDPLKDVDLNSINLNKGLINYIVPKNAKINNLNLIIKSNTFGEQITYLHSNLFCLFGTHFVKDISSININLYNPKEEKCFNDRQIIKSILDFMCFKTIKLVNINKNLMYYVIPENSEFAIVLAFKEINYEEKHANFLNNLEDLIFHQYSKFSDTTFNLKRCLAAIDKTIPKEVTNLILPAISVNLPSLEEIINLRKKIIDEEKEKEKGKEKENEDKEIIEKLKNHNISSDHNCNNEFSSNPNEENKNNLFEEIKIEGDFNKKNYNKNNSNDKFYNCQEKKIPKIFENLNFFLNEIRHRNFKVISFELKISLDKLDEYINKNNDNHNYNENKDNSEYRNNSYKFPTEFYNDNNKQNNPQFEEEENLIENYNDNLYDDNNNNQINITNNNNNSNPLISSDNIYTETKAKNHGGPPETKTHYLYKRQDINNNMKINKIKNNSNNNKNKQREEIIEEQEIQKYSEQYIQVLEIFLDENIEILKEFQQVVISFDFDFKGKYNLKNSLTKRNKYIAYHFKKLIVKKKLENLTLIHHISFKIRNSQTLLDDQFDFLDYVFFMKETADELYKKLFLFKYCKELTKISKRKNVMFKILSDYIFDFANELFTEGRLDYSYQVLRNMKIVPMQINADSSMIFMNN